MSDFLPAIHAGDSLVIRVTVSDGDGPLALTGATVAAKAQATTGASVTLSATVTNAAQGEITVSLPAATIAEGVYAVQARVTLPNGEAQTVTDARLTVQRSVL